MICCNRATAPGSLAAYYRCQARLALNALLKKKQKQKQKINSRGCALDEKKRKRFPDFFSACCITVPQGPFSLVLMGDGCLQIVIAVITHTCHIQASAAAAAGMSACARRRTDSGYVRGEKKTQTKAIINIDITLQGADARLEFLVSGCRSFFSSSQKTDAHM